MNIVQNLMGRLRPGLVGLKAWDYCVLWKLSEDQRFIEWMDCCCAGTESTDENGGEELHFPVSSVLPCRDILIQHPRTKSCELLAQLPSSMPLDSGIHAQTLMSNQTSWLNFSNNSDSNAMEETIGTRVLIPVPGVLIELFVTNQVVPEDQNVIDFITTQCNISMEQQEAMINSIDNNMDASYQVNIHSLNEQELKSLFANEEEHQKDSNNHLQPPPISPTTSLETNLSFPYDITANQIPLCSSSSMNFFQQFNIYASENNTKNDASFEGSHDAILEMDVLEKSMNMSNTTNNMHMQFVDPNLANKEQQGNDKDSIKQENGRSDSISDCSDQIDDVNHQRRPQSKNLVAERKRRKKLNDRLLALRALVPKISKLDRASILGDAIEFVKELQKQEKELKDELEDHSDIDDGSNHMDMINGNDNNNIVPSEIFNQNNGINNIGSKPEHNAPNGFHVGGASSSCNGTNLISKQNQDPEISSDKGQQQQMEPQVEVAQINGNEFYVKVFCEHKPGGFTRLMEALDSLGLEVTNANATSFRSLVSNVFKVEKKDSDMVQADHIRESLLELTRKPFRRWTEMTRTKESNNGMDFHHHHQRHLHNHHIISPHQHHLHHFP